MNALSDIVTGIVPSARMVELSLDGEWASVITGTGEGAPAAGSRFRSSMLPALAHRLRERGSYTLHADDPRLSKDSRAILELLHLNHGYFGLVCGTETKVECVVVDVPSTSEPFSDTDLGLIDAVVRLARAARENEVLRSQAAQRQRMLEAIARLGIVFTSALDLRQTAEQVVDYASLLLDLPAFLLMYRPEGAPHFTVLAQEGLPLEVMRFAATPIEVAALDVRRPGELAIKPMPASEHSTLLGFLLESEFAHVLVAPLVVEDDRLRGVLLGLDQHAIELDEQERETFHLLSLQATNAVWNAERYEAEVRSREEARQELETTSMLLRAADLLARSLDTETIIGGLVGLVREATGIEQIAVSLLDETSRELVLQMGTGLPVEFGARLPERLWPRELSDSFEQHRSVLLEPRSDAGPTPAEWLLEKALSIPLVFKGRILGNIGVIGDASHRLSRRVIRRLEALAAQASVAIENAVLYQQQSNVAEVLQQSLLTLPDRIAGIRFANAYHAASAAGHVGGDFYDLFEIGPHLIGVVVGDISGKGLEAAVLTSLMKNTLRAHTAEPEKGPGEILRLTNEIVYRETSSEQFATAFFGILDITTGRLTYTNAGHTTTAVLHGDGTVSALPSTGPLVGAFEAMQFGEGGIVLAPGDSLLLYTDGLTEARRDREEFGEERLLTLLSRTEAGGPEGMIARITDEVEQFTGGVLRDDLALLAIEFTGTGPAQS